MFDPARSRSIPLDDVTLDGARRPFLADWLAAFGLASLPAASDAAASAASLDAASSAASGGASGGGAAPTPSRPSGGLLVLRAEQMLDAPAVHRPRLLQLLGLPLTPPAGSAVSADGPPSYMAMHAATLRSYNAQPMLNTTRAALDAFYAPHCRRLAQLLGWEPSVWQRSAPPTAEHFAEGAAVVYRRYGPHFPSSQRTVYRATSEAKRPRGPRRERMRRANG